MAIICMAGTDRVSFHPDQLSILESMTEDLRIVHVRYDEYRSTITTDSFIEVFREIPEEIDFKEFVFLDPEQRPEPLRYEPLFLLKSGKISRCRNNHTGKMMIWTPPIAHKPCIIFNKTFIRRFRGHNRGRHWDRKRR